jgi:hypothetical protein
LTQPYAWLVIHGGKDIENRRWNTNYRGHFLVHAAKGMKGSDYDAAWEAARRISQNLAWSIPPKEKLERGGIIGDVELFGVVRPLGSGDPDQRQLAAMNDVQYDWHFVDQFGFRLRDPLPLPFLPCKGSLGFWGNFEIRDGQAVQL